jgi:hypothetical protein
VNSAKGAIAALKHPRHRKAANRAVLRIADGEGMGEGVLDADVIEPAVGAPIQHDRRIASRPELRCIRVAPRCAVPPAGVALRIGVDEPQALQARPLDLLARHCRRYACPAVADHGGGARTA